MNDLELDHLRDDLLNAAGQLFEAEQHINRAWTNITNALPGYRADTLPVGRATGTSIDTQPERYQTIRHDHANIARAELLTLTRSALAAASAIRRITAAWSEPPMPATPTRIEPDDWCTSCIRVGKCSPLLTADLCRWCYDFERAEHQRPPIKLVKLHHEGRRITQQMVDDALGRKPRKTANSR